jgi:hypothetical protein
MATIQYKGVSLELYADTTIKLKRLNSFFSSDLRADFSFPIDLPYSTSELNRSVLVDLNIPQAINKKSKVSILFEYAGRFQLAEMVFRNLEEDLTVNIYFDKTELTCLNVDCNKLNIPNFKTLQNLYSDGISKVYPETLAYFPMLVNSVFYDTEADTDPDEQINPAYRNILNAYNSTTGSWIENQVVNTEAVNSNTLVPQVSVMAVLKAAFELDGYAVDGDFFRNKTERKLFVFGNKSLDKRVAPTIFQEAKATRLTYNKVIIGDRVYRLLFSSATAAFANSCYQAGELGTFVFTLNAEVLKWQNMTVLLVASDSSGVLKSWTYETRGSGLGTYKKSIDVVVDSNILNSEIYIEVSVELGYRASGGEIDLSHIKLEVVKKGNPLIEFYNPDDLGTFLPEMKFADFLNALINARLLTFDIDRERKQVLLNYRNQVFSNRNRTDLSESFSGRRKVMFEPGKKYLVKYEAFSEVEKNRGDSIYKYYMMVDKDGKAQYYKGDPSEFDGTEIVLKTYPMVSQYFAQSPFPDGLNTLLAQVEGQRDVLLTDGKPLQKLRLGFAATDGNGYPIATNSIGDISLALDSLPGSLGHNYGVHLSYRNKDARTYSLICTIDKRELDSLKVAEPVVIESLPYVIVEVNPELSGDDLVDVDIVAKAF